MPITCHAHATPPTRRSWTAYVRLRIQKWWATDLRKHLRAAGTLRAELFDTDDTRKRLRFHDLRSTGITWMAIRGDDPLKIQQRAGHASFDMTQKYIRTAEAVGEAIGEVFPPLPECLLAGANRPANRPGELQLVETIVEAPGIEAERPAGKRWEAAAKRWNSSLRSPIRFPRVPACSRGS